MSIILQFKKRKNIQSFYNGKVQLLHFPILPVGVRPVLGSEVHIVETREFAGTALLLNTLGSLSRAIQELQGPLRAAHLSAQVGAFLFKDQG